MGLEGIGSAIGGLIGSYTSGKGGQGKLQQISRLWKELNTPDFDLRSLEPYELNLVAEYFPETYDAIISGQPELAEEGPQGREAQLASLGQLDTYAREGLGLGEKLAAQSAGFRVRDEAARANQALRGELAQRGRLGGGTEVAYRLGAGQQAANLGGQLGRDLMQQSIENRYRSNLARAEAGSRLREQDLARSQSRANAVNRFNELTSQLRTQAARDAAASRQQAAFGNVGNRQRIAEENARAQYGTNLSNLERQNMLRQQGFENDVTKLRGYTGALANEGAYQEAKRAQRINNAASVGGLVGGVADIGVGAFTGGGGLGGLLGGSGGGGGGYGAPAASNFGYNPNSPFAQYEDGRFNYGGLG